MLGRALIVAACLVAAAVGVTRADRGEDTPLRQPFSTFPMQLGGWQGTQRPPFADKILEVLGLDDYITRFYSGPNGAVVDLYVGYWKSQQQGDTIHSPQNCLPGAGWEPASQGLLTFPDPRRKDGAQLSVKRFVIQKGLAKQVVLYWYQGRGRVEASEYWSKIYLVVDAARLNRTDAALVRIVAPVRGTTKDAEDAAEREAVAFATALIPALSQYLPD